MTHLQFDQRLDRYASVAVQIGLNLQPGQRLLISASLDAAELVHHVAKHAYQRGGHLVETIWNDPQLTLARFENAPRDSFDVASGWSSAAGIEYARNGDAVLSIVGSDPTLLAGQDLQLVARMQQAVAERAAGYTELASSNAMNWCVIASPVQGWAAQVFPDLPADKQLERLWDAVFRACRLDEDEPVAAWETHAAQLGRRKAYMTAHQFEALHFRGPGTDLTVGLPEGHRWLGGQDTAANGISHILNLPTEEIFTLPARTRVNGYVRSTRALPYAGSLIKSFTLTFENGQVSRVQAEQGEDLLRSIVDIDEGSAFLGEVALVPEDSPIARSGLLFHNTLFDENAASHLALGRAYRQALDGGQNMDDDAFVRAGGNISSAHVDFMIGSADIDIDGLLADGTAEPIMRRGRWAFDVTP